MHDSSGNAMGLPYPSLYEAADAAAVASQRTFFVALATNLMLFVVVSVLSGLHSSSAVIWFIAGLLLVINFALTLALATFKPERSWFSARAIAESVKTATWRFVSRAEPFDQEDEQAARTAFLNRLRDIFSQNLRFSRRFVNALDGEQLPNALLLHRRLDLTVRKSRYRDLRVLEQRAWYTRNAKEKNRAAVASLAVTLIAMALAILLHFWRGLDSRWAYWPGDSIVTFALGIFTWLQAKRYQELSETYAIAAQDISFVEAELATVETEEAFSKYVADAENAFSREHTQWIARKDS